MEDLPVLIVMGLCGVLFIYLGYLVWIKEKINIIHEYYYTKVQEKDKKPYTAIMGKATILIGIGMILTGVASMVVHSGSCMIIFGIFFAIGLIMMTYAQIKYNHGII